MSFIVKVISGSNENSPSILNVFVIFEASIPTVTTTPCTVPYFCQVSVNRKISVMNAPVDFGENSTFAAKAVKTMCLSAFLHEMFDSHAFRTLCSS